MGPLTNLALACHIQPMFLKLVRAVVILGGAVLGKYRLLSSIFKASTFDTKATVHGTLSTLLGET